MIIQLQKVLGQLSQVPRANPPENRVVTKPFIHPSDYYLSGRIDMLGLITGQEDLSPSREDLALALELGFVGEIKGGLSILARGFSPLKPDPDWWNTFAELMARSGRMDISTSILGELHGDVDLNTLVMSAYYAFSQGKADAGKKFLGFGFSTLDAIKISYRISCAQNDGKQKIEITAALNLFSTEIANKISKENVEEYEIEKLLKMLLDFDLYGSAFKILNLLSKKQRKLLRDVERTLRSRIGGFLVKDERLMDGDYLIRFLNQTSEIDDAYARLAWMKAFIECSKRSFNPEAIEVLAPDIKKLIGQFKNEKTYYRSALHIYLQFQLYRKNPDFEEIISIAKRISKGDLYFSSLNLLSDELEFNPSNKERLNTLIESLTRCLTSLEMISDTSPPAPVIVGFQLRSESHFEESPLILGARIALILASSVKLDIQRDDYIARSKDLFRNSGFMMFCDYISIANDLISGIPVEPMSSEMKNRYHGMTDEKKAFIGFGLSYISWLVKNSKPLSTTQNLIRVLYSYIEKAPLSVEC